VIQQVTNQQVNETLGQGTLSRQERASLADVLAKCDVATLPAKEGMDQANAHQFKIEFGDRVSTLVLGTGKPLPKSRPFAGVTSAVEQMLARKEE
jgi:hypothetical protein